MDEDHRQGRRHPVDQEHPARAADRQDRPRRADRADGAGRSVDPLREGRPDGPDALRPPGLGQDDDLRQARPAACQRRAASRCWSRPTSSGRRPSSSSRSSAARSASRSSARPTRTRSRSASRPWSRPTAQGCDTLILDTAGRLHVDDELMAELTQIEKKVKPHQVFFVCDAMTGQDAVASADAFNKALELDGVILTKLDGDARGGAALSVRKVTGVPDQVRRQGREARQARAVRSRAAGRPDAGHGRHRRPGRGGPVGGRRGRGPAPARKARQGEVRPRRLPQADRQHEEDGLDRGSS